MDRGDPFLWIQNRSGAAGHEQEHGAAHLPDQGLAGPQTDRLIPAPDSGTALRGAGPQRALGHRPVPHLGRQGQVVHSGSRHRLLQQGTAGLAALAQRPGPNARGSAGACPDRTVRHIGAGSTPLPAALGQWPGVHQPQLYQPGQKLRTVAGVHHPTQS